MGNDRQISTSININLPGSSRAVIDYIEVIRMYYRTPYTCYKDREGIALKNKFWLHSHFIHTDTIDISLSLNTVLNN